jgi:outer membrane protein assembly factor BamE (lipoprotein component of BamABCDE complex)
MNTKSVRMCVGLTVVSLAVLGAGTVHAASGYVITPAEGKQVKSGMSRQEVRQLLGRPAHDMKYRNEPGRTWTYGVLGPDEKVFDIEFSSDGRVVLTNERIETLE